MIQIIVRSSTLVWQNQNLKNVSPTIKLLFVTNVCNERYEKETELSKEIWKLKKKDFVPNVTWKTIRQCAPFNRAALKCNLCLNEKLEIATFPDNDRLLNSRNELISKCRHVNKFTLKKLHDSKD